MCLLEVQTSLSFLTPQSDSFVARIMFVSVFILPWLLQACIFLEFLYLQEKSNRNIFPELFTVAKSVRVPANEEKNEEEALEIAENSDKHTNDEELGTPVEEHNISHKETSPDTQRIAAKIHICGVISVILAAAISGRISNQYTLHKFSDSVVSVTWMNCFVISFLLFTGDKETEQSKKQVNTVIREVLSDVKRRIIWAKGFVFGIEEI